jgi:hypothetical protein
MEFFRSKQIAGELMQGNHNVPFRNSSPSFACAAVRFAWPSNGRASESLRSLLSVLPLQLKLWQNGKLGAKRQILNVVDFYCISNSP